MRGRPNDAPFDPERRAAALWYLRAASIGVLLFFILGAGAVIWRQHEDVIADQRTELGSLCAVSAEQTMRYVQLIEVNLREIQARIMASDLRSAAEFRAAWGDEDTHRLLRARLQNLPQANAFILIGADGRVINSSRGFPELNINVRNRDFYQHFRDHDDPNLFVSEVVIGQVSATPILFLARRINGPDGIFLGIVAAAVGIGPLQDFYRGLALPEGETITLLRSDGAVLARHPDPTRAVGGRIPPQMPWHGVVARGADSFVPRNRCRAGRASSRRIR